MAYLNFPLFIMCFNIFRICERCWAETTHIRVCYFHNYKHASENMFPFKQSS